MKRKIFYLTGFMASGKSTIGPILANTLGWNFYDLDRVIEEKAGMKITQIFNTHGEKYFRELEKFTLQEISHDTNMIIALGGGTIADQSNVNFMKRKGKIIYLQASPEAYFSRLRFKKDRPSLIGENQESLSAEELKKKISVLLSQREKYYYQADIIINTDGVTIGKTVDKLSKIILSDIK